MTVPERTLWQRLRGRQCCGIKFTRQHPIGDFIVDFVAREQRLIIELDGDSHHERAAYDIRRQRALEASGYRVLRISNEDILGDVEGVLEGLSVYLAKNVTP